MKGFEKILEEIEKAKGEPWYRLNNYDVRHKLDGAINRIVEIIRKHMNDGWIPVEERLPEDGTYLCTLAGELCGIEEPFTGMCGIENGIWDEPDCVIAWHPLPEPYHAERSRE